VNHSSVDPARARIFFWCGFVVGGLIGAVTLAPDVFSPWPNWIRVVFFAVVAGYGSEYWGRPAWQWFRRVLRR
jgi:hypothetical protein